MEKTQQQPRNYTAETVGPDEHPATLPRANQSRFCTEAGDIIIKVHPDGTVTITGGKEVIWNGNPCLKTPASSDGQNLS